MADKRELKSIHIFMCDQKTTRLVCTTLEQNLPSRLELCDGSLPINWPQGELGVLYVTDVPEWAGLLVAAGCPVLVYVHEENKATTFPGIQYVIEGFEETDEIYFQKVFYRLTGQPWHILDTARCMVRETVAEDLDAFYAIYMEPSITKYMENLNQDKRVQKGYLEDYAKKIYGFLGFGMWTVLLRETGEIIGRAGLDIREGFKEPELGFVIGLPWQRRGLAEEVCRAIITYGFQELGLESIRSIVDPDNLPSVELCSKLGDPFQEDVVLKGKTYTCFQFFHELPLI